MRPSPWRGLETGKSSGRWCRCWKTRTIWSEKPSRGRWPASDGLRPANKAGAGKGEMMADEAPKIMQSSKGGTGIKKGGFNLISEKVVKVDVEHRTMEIELLAYEGKTVVLEVGEELLEELKTLKVGDGVTVRVVEEDPGGTLHGAPTKRRIVKGFTIRSRDANKSRADEMLAALKEPHWLTRKYAVEVLGALGDARAVGPLIEALTDEVNDIRQRAYESLIKIGAPSVPAVASLLTHEDDDLRQVASEIIRKPGKPAVEPLTEVMLTADETLQARIRKLLDRMGYKPKPKTEVM